jgi:hypothetical protein
MCLSTKKSLASGCWRPSRNATVRQAHALGADLEDQTLVLAEELLGELHPLRERAVELLDLARRRERLDRRIGERVDLVLDALGEEILEMVGVEIVRPDPEEEAVEDRGQRLVGRHLVRGTEAREERTLEHHAARRVAALVEEREQRVEDGGVRLEDLVEEDDLRARQHALDPSLVTTLAEGRDVDRPEEFVRLGEARQEVLEVVRLQQAREHPDERALGGAGRSDEYRVLARDDGDEQEADDLVLAEKARLELTRHLREAHRESRAS